MLISTTIVVLSYPCVSHVLMPGLNFSNIRPGTSNWREELTLETHISEQCGGESLQSLGLIPGKFLLQEGYAINSLLLPLGDG